MNDFLQGIVMLVGIIAVIVAVLFNNGGFMPVSYTHLDVYKRQGRDNSQAARPLRHDR